MQHFPDPALDEAPDAPDWRDSLPDVPHTWRGLALSVAALVLGRMAWGIIRRRPLAFPLAVPLFAVAVLSAWGGAVHLAGGQKYDDQVWH